VPLVSSFWLSTKPGKEAWVEPVIEGKNYRFEVRVGKPRDKNVVDAGTKLGRGANFRCLLSQSPLSQDHIRGEFQAKRASARLMAIVAEGVRGRVYLSPQQEHEAVAESAKPKWVPEAEMNQDCKDLVSGRGYGFKKWHQIFTPRQLVALTTFSDLVAEAREKIATDAAAAATLADDKRPLREGGRGHIAYSEAVSVYLGIALSRLTNSLNSLSLWSTSREQTVNLFSRQAIPMVWDYPEINPTAGAAGDYSIACDSIARAMDGVPASETNEGVAYQHDAASNSFVERSVLISSDPPYYDNISYADLSDFFYVWMRPPLHNVFPALFATVVVPKAEELVAASYRHGSYGNAEKFFLQGMTRAMQGMAKRSAEAFPVTLYYAFRQSEQHSEGISSTGWETFLDAVLEAGLGVNGTWPMRTERPTGVKVATNALASSIVMVCRPRPADAPMTTRKDFLAALRKELPPALRHLQRGNIAPVDLAQASIGPGMAVFLALQPDSGDRRQADDGADGASS
jgi:putative DNA methylase